jgi:outer membrane protein assembly factor BamB
VARGPDATYAVRARDGKRVWRFGAGKYANPVVADDHRLYITGQSTAYALAPRGSEAARADARRDRPARDRPRRSASARSSNRAGAG